MKIEILPSLLAADFGNLGAGIKLAENALSDAIHLDIMDPHFVPNISFGPDVVALSRKVSPGLYRNVHLMMKRPDLYISKFAEAGSQTIQIHIEADCDIHATLKAIRELGIKNSIVLNPETPVSLLEPYLDEIDGVLVMTVHPGYGGQKFIADCLPKVEYLRSRLPEIDIMVDGGINGITAVMAVEAGANQLVAGSYLYGKADMKVAVAEMREACEKAVSR
jgi:ribulose-phosphate 3-epimerase